MTGPDGGLEGPGAGAGAGGPGERANGDVPGAVARVPGRPGAPGKRDPRTGRAGWHQRSDHGRDKPWANGLAFRRELQRRERLARRRQQQALREGSTRFSRARQGFGCLFAMVFVVLLGSVVTAAASLLSTLGPVPAVIVVIAAVVIVAALVRGLLGASRDLDAMLVAVRRVQGGDYGVRLGRTQSDLAPIQELGRGFDTMAARLEADEEQQQALLADVSHELRTPLSVITANLEGIIDGIYPADEVHLAAILDETRVLERLIEDLRTVTLSEAGSLPLHPEPSDIELLVREVVRSYAAAASGAGVSLLASPEPGQPLLEVDPVRTREVVSNLVANALRHTPAGGTVEVASRTTAEAVTVTVRDTGPGIAPELLPHVFERFVKGDGSHGSGLGLAIARGLVEAQGGSVGVTSNPGEGATFTVRLPRGATGSATDADADAGSAARPGS